MKVVYPICCGVDVYKTFLVATIIKTTDGVTPTYAGYIGGDRYGGPRGEPRGTRPGRPLISELDLRSGERL